MENRTADATPKPARSLWNQAADLGERILDALYFPGTGLLSRLARGIWMAGLLVYGSYLWGIFFSRGNISFDFLDWAEVTGPRYALLRDAAEKGILPLHAGNTTALRGVTDRYFSIADTPFSPQHLFLPYLEPGQFIFYETLLFYWAGFLGLLLIAKKYRLAPLPLTLLFLIFNFNGFMTAHLAVGHTIWTAFFLLPFLVLLLLHLVETERPGWRWVTGLALLQLAVLLQGGFHLFLWVLLFLGLLALFNRRLIQPAGLGIIFSVLVSLPRLLPPALALSGITQEYLGGFASVTDLIGGMVILRDPQHAIGAITDTFRLNAWEIDFYIGLLGFALVVIFGVLVPLRRGQPGRATAAQLLAGCLVFTAFSIGDVFGQVVRVFTVPPLTGERVTARMFILPLSIMMVLAAVHFQRVLEQRLFQGADGKTSVLVKVLSLTAAAVLFHDLYQHLEAWRIRYLDAMVDLFPKVPFDPAQHTIANHADPLYTGLLAGGSAVALLALAFLVVMAVRERKRPLLQT